MLNQLTLDSRLDANLALEIIAGHKMRAAWVVFQNDVTRRMSRHLGVQRV